MKYLDSYKALVDALMDRYTFSDGFKQLKEIYRDMKEIKE